VAKRETVIGGKGEARCFSRRQKGGSLGNALTSGGNPRLPWKERVGSDPRLETSKEKKKFSTKKKERIKSI